MSFDGRILELFWPDRSRRIHVQQILYAEVHTGELMLESSAILELWLLNGQSLSVAFTMGCRPGLERLVQLLPAPV